MFPGREEPASPVTPIKRRSFATTHWSVVLATRDLEPDRARQAFEQLCATYWYPIYACVRGYGKDHHEAEDLTQGFWALLLSNQALQHHYLKDTIQGATGGPTHAELGRLLGMSPGAVAVTVHRLRKRFAELCREAVAHTVDDPAEVDEELDYLLKVLGD